MILGYILSLRMIHENVLCSSLIKIMKIFMDHPGTLNISKDQGDQARLILDLENIHGSRRDQARIDLLRWTDLVFVANNCWGGLRNKLQ